MRSILFACLSLACACSTERSGQGALGEPATRHDGGLADGSRGDAGDSTAPPDAAAAPSGGAWDDVTCRDDPERLDVMPGAEALAEPLGSVLRCAEGETFTAERLHTLAESAGFVGEPLGSGARLVRIAYRTERGSEPPRPGFGVATVLLPERPRAAQLPVLVMAHGTIGEAPTCPPSREDANAEDTYLAELGFALVGAGYAVILPDYAGYAAFGAPDNPPAGYHAALDEAKSVLDAARALRKLLPGRVSSQLVLLGHSQGGHAVLSALALHAQYGSDAELAGVVAYAPSWFPLSSFGGMLALPGDYTLPDEADAVAASVWYHYSHAELLDGPGQGALPFAAEKRDAIDRFFREQCDPAAIAALGSDVGALFDPGFSGDVAYFAGAGLPCLSERCTTWVERYRADRPHLEGAARTVPILLVHGDQDDWIPPERAACGFDRLEADGAALTVCIVPGAMHDPVIGMRAAYVNDWIGARTLGGVDPGPCGPGREALHDTSGNAATCALLPPND